MKKIQIILGCVAFTILLNKATAQNNNFITLPSGISYQFATNANSKKMANVSDILSLHIRAYVSDSMLFDSYKLNNNEPVPAQLAAPQFNGDIMEILKLMAEGDSVVAKVPQDSLFRQEGMKPPFAKAGDMVIYQLKLISVKSKEEFEKTKKESELKIIAAQEATILNYIKENNITNAQKTASGLYYIITKKGMGATVPKGEKVTMNYVGMLMNGEKFDSNILPEFNHVSPFEFKLGVGQVIRGWDEGIALLNKGAKAKLIIPSPLAYGSQSPSPAIPANSVLIFDVEVVDFESASKAPVKGAAKPAIKKAVVKPTVKTIKKATKK